MEGIARQVFDRLAPHSLVLVDFVVGHVLGCLCLLGLACCASMVGHLMSLLGVTAGSG